MKKHFVLLAVMLLVAAFTSPIVLAQQTRYKEYDRNTGLTALGIKGGVNIASLVGTGARTPDGDNLKYRTGAMGGIFAEYTITRGFAIQPELLYTVRGAKWSENEEGVNHDYRTRVDYIEIPVLAKFSFYSRSQLQPNIYAGPDISFRTRARLLEKAPGIDTDVDIKDNVKSTDFGITTGIGASLGPVGSGRFTADARYYSGIVKVDDTPAHLSERNSNFMFLLGYSFK